MMWMSLPPPYFYFFLYKIYYLKNWFLHLGWCLRGKIGPFNGHLVFGKVLVLTYRNYLIRDTPSSTYLFRILIPKDLRDYFGGRTSFKVSLRNGIKNECLIFSKLLYLEVQSIFKEIRMGKESNITLKQIQEILREKIERTILHSRHFVTDTNTFIESEVKKRIEEVENYEELLKTRIYLYVKNFWIPLIKN